MSTQSTEWQIPEWSRGDRFRKAREARGYKQNQFAELIGASARTVGKYENDEVEPRKIMVNAWALATGVPSSWLLYGVVPSRPDGDPEDGTSGNDVVNVTRTAQVRELRPRHAHPIKERRIA